MKKYPLAEIADRLDRLIVMKDRAVNFGQIIAATDGQIQVAAEIGWHSFARQLRIRKALLSTKGAKQK